MVRPRPGTIFDPALRAARAPPGQLHFAGSELSGVSLFEEALDHGVRAAAEGSRRWAAGPSPHETRRRIGTLNASLRAPLGAAAHFAGS